VFDADLHRLSDRFVFDPCQKPLDHSELDIRVEQRLPNLLQGWANVLRAEFSQPRETVLGLTKSFNECVEQGVGLLAQPCPRRTDQGQKAEVFLRLAHFVT
jgi:hypothetical protein